MDRQLRTRFAAAIRWPKLCANLTGVPGSQAPSAPIRPSVSSGNPEIEPVEGMTGGARVTLAYDGMENLVPKKRIHFNFDGPLDEPLAAGHRQFPILESQPVFAKTFAERYTILNGMSGGTTVNQYANGLPHFSLGGALSLNALAPPQYFGDNCYFNGMYFMQALSSARLSMWSKLRLTAGYELGNDFTCEPSKPYSEGVVGQTGLGIAFVGGSHGERGEKKFLFRLGRFF